MLLKRCFLAILLVLLSVSAQSATTMKRYYAHDAVADKYGVIAPWYTGLNGQLDYRVRVAAETMKRYPWVDTTRAAAAAPEYVWSGLWQITPEGAITAVPVNAGADGDRLQRDAFVILSLADYYRYTGDPSAIAIISIAADVIVNHCQTDSTHPWPNFVISVPMSGKPYGNCDPKGLIQLDIAAEAGMALMRAYELTGNKTYLDASKHWADLLAQHCNLDPKSDPWERYANPENSPWGQNPMTGNVAYVLYFLDELIRTGYTGDDNAIVKARDAGRSFLRHKILPKWTVVDTWGRNFWDWPCNAQCEYTTNWACRYMMENKDCFPNWRNDVRNILGLYINHTSVAPESSSEAYHGSWQFPESPGCCGRSLWYGSMELAWIFAQYGVEANSEWAREIARRQQILTTYDISDTGVSQDNIDGGFIVCGSWFKIAHPMALRHVLQTIAWLPEELGANRENHIVRSGATVNSVIYADGRVAYSTFDAPKNAVDVLRLAFTPASVMANGKALKKRKDLKANGYTAKRLSNGDCILTIRHDGATKVVIQGSDPQEFADDPGMACTGTREDIEREGSIGGLRRSDSAGATMSYEFNGNQVRLIGSVGPDGGKADVYLDGVKQLVGIDCWNPSERNQQALYYKNGLPNGRHTIKIEITGTKNPYSSGANVYVDGIQWSKADGSAGFGEGGGPTDVQRLIFGYAGRGDFIDSKGKPWHPGLEYIIRLGSLVDSVAASWWNEAVDAPIANTDDPDLYRYGVHGPQFIVNLTVGPGKYHVRLKFAAARNLDPEKNLITVQINGQEVVTKMNVAERAGGTNRALDLVFKDIAPQNGIIEVRLTGSDKEGAKGEAFLQALELGPENGSK